MLLKIIFTIIALAAQPKNDCSKPMENLIIVNFTTSKLTIYINSKKLGTVAKEDQKNFKKSLPVGAVNVKVANSAKQIIHEEDYSIASLGKQTCKNNKAIVIR